MKPTPKKPKPEEKKKEEKALKKSKIVQPEVKKNTVKRKTSADVVIGKPKEKKANFPLDISRFAKPKKTVTGGKKILQKRRMFHEKKERDGNDPRKVLTRN